MPNEIYSINSSGVGISPFPGTFDHINCVNIIGSVIRQLRAEKGMSQELLSGLAGLDRTHYSKIERGLRNPTIETIFKIAAALEIPPHEIIIRIEAAMQNE